MNRPPAALPPELALLLTEPVAAELRDAAGSVSCQLVGGVLRDRLLHRPNPDWDASVDSAGAAIAHRFAARRLARVVDLGGQEFASYRIVAADFVLDLWDRQGAGLDSDLDRRDFSINAMALDLATGAFHDPHAGRHDLEAGLLRSTTRETFSADPLRVLRLVRFSSALGFSVDPETRRQARRAVPDLASVAVERIRDELDKILDLRPLSESLAELRALGLLPALWTAKPVFPDPQLGQRLERLAASWSGIRDHPALAPSDRLAVIHAALAQLLDPTGRGAAVAASMRERGLWTVGRGRRTVALLGLGKWPQNDTERRWFLAEWGPRWIDAAAYLTILDPPTGATDPEEEAQHLLRLVSSGAAVGRPRALLDGHEVQELLDLEPGPEVGAALEGLIRGQLEGTVKTPQEARSFLLSKGLPTTKRSPNAD